MIGSPERLAVGVRAPPSCLAGGRLGDRLGPVTGDLLGLAVA